MTRQQTASPHRTSLLVIGVGLMGIALLALFGLGVWVMSKSDMFGSAVAADAMLYVDTPGRIAVDRTLQIEGPAPVPVSPGDHELTFFDASSQEPLTVSVAQGQFTYVPNQKTSRFYPNAKRGIVDVAAFPPDTTIEIADCTPVDAKFPVQCRGTHLLSADVSPGTYTLRYTHPRLGEYTEQFTITADSRVRREHSFITTVKEWDEWRSQYGQIIEHGYSRPRYRSSGVLLLPFAVAGALLGY